MDNSQHILSSQYRWTRWLPRILLFIAFLANSLYPFLSIGVDDWNGIFGVALSSPIFFIISILALRWPLGAGIAALFTAAFWFFLILSEYVNPHYSPTNYDLYSLAVGIIWLIGGILSVRWGIIRRRWQVEH